MVPNPTDRAIFRLAIPSVVSNITVPLLGLVDLSIVGHLGHTQQIGAIAIGGTVFNMVYWVFSFLRMGTTGLTSQAHGAADKDRCATTLLRSLLVAMVLATILLVLQKPILQLAILLMQPSPQVLPYFQTYFRLCIWGAPAMLASYTLTGWFIGMQNTRIPMQVAILQNVTNILLSLLLALGLGWGLQGVALGTVCGLYAGIVLSICQACRLWRREQLLVLRVKALFSRSQFMQFIRINADIFLRTLCLISVMSFFTYAGSAQNDIILSANALLLEFFMLFSYFMDGLANAAEALSGEFDGGKKLHLFQQTLIRLFGWSLSLVGLFTLLFVALGTQFLHVLTNQPEVIQMAQHYLPYVWVIPLISFMAFIWDGVFIGLCWSRSMLISMFLATVVFFTLYFTAAGSLGNHALWLAFCSYLFVRGGVQTLQARAKLQHKR